MEDIIDIIVTETTNTIEITSQPTDEIIDVNIIDNREDITLNVTPSLVEININSLTGNFGVEWGDITGTLADQTDLNTALGLKADLVGGKVPSSQLPSYVDDIVEVANYAALPATGETGKIYVVLDTNKIYRWSGSAYIEIADSTAVWGAITGTLSSQTDLQNALNAKFNNPTGDTTQYIAGDGSLITFPVAGQAGTLVREVRNTTGATLTKGTIVYISGATGNKPTVSKAIATGDSTSAQTFGMCQANISNNSNGYVVCVGDITGLDTSALSEGVQLYLSSTTAGTYTTTKQLAPAHLVYIGVVTRSHPTQGQIEVKIQNGYELDEIHDVAISSVANNDGIFYESSTSLWKNKSIATVLGYTPQAQLNGTGFVKISGTTISYDNSTYALDSAVVHNTGTESVGGIKTFTSQAVFNNSFIIKNTNSGSVSYGGNTTIWTSDDSFNILVGTASSTTKSFSFIYGSNVQLTLPSSDGTLALVSNLSAYLPLAGGTLTGALSGTSVSLSSSITASALYVTGMTAGSGAIYHTGSRLTFANYNASGTLHFEVNGGTGALTINADTSATFTGQINSITGVFGTKGGGSYGVLISDNDQSNVRLKFTNTGSGGRSYSIVGGLPGANNSSFAIYDETAGSTRFNIDSSGAATFSSSVTATSLKLNTTASTGSNFIVAGYADFWNATNTLLRVQHDGTRATLQAYTSGSNGIISLNPDGGNVGIGTTSPSTKLTVFGDWMNVTDGTVNVYFGSDGSGGQLGTVSNHYQRFVTNNTERMRITSGGNLLIGTTSESGDAKLVVSGRTYTEGIYVATGSFSQGGAATGTFYTFSNSATNRVFLITVRQQGSGVNSVIGVCTTYSTGAAAYNVGQDNTNPAVQLTLSTSGLGLRLTTGAGYGTTTWEYTITQIK